MVTFKQLEAMYWVSRLGTFGAAAEKLHTSESAISKRIGELELFFETALFDRSRRTAQLTPKGKELLEMGVFSICATSCWTIWARSALEADIPQDQCPSWRAFNQKYQTRYGHPPSTYSRYAYNAAGALIQAIRQVGSINAVKVASALHGIHYARAVRSLSIRGQPPQSSIHPVSRRRGELATGAVLFC